VSYAKKPYTVALPGRIYEDLYAARNAFMHGNPVRSRELRFRQSPNRPSLLLLAPLLYNLVLRAALERVLPAPVKLIDVDEQFFGLGVIEKGLCAALRGGSKRIRIA
jgi:hypothetical protein